MPKVAVRSELIARRCELPPDCWRAASTAAQQRLLALEPFRQATVVALYAPIQQEIDTTLLFDAAKAAGKQVLYPQVRDGQLQFRLVTDLHQLVSGAYRIPEPGLAHSLMPFEQVDLIVVPGVAFDLQGHRIGFGKGYYDRCLSQRGRHATLVGICHDFQLIERIPAEGHDISMQYIVTEHRLITIEGEYARSGRNRQNAGLT